MAFVRKRDGNGKRSKKLERIGIEKLKNEFLVIPQSELSMRLPQVPPMSLSNQLGQSCAQQAFIQMEEQSKRLSRQFLAVAESLSHIMAPQAASLNYLYEAITPFTEQLARMYHPPLDFGQPIDYQTHFFSDSLRQIQTLQDRWRFETINPFTGVTDYFRAIPREDLLKVNLHAEYWLVSDVSLLSKIVEKRLDQDTEVVPYVINYYKENNWIRFERLLESWHQHIPKERTKSFGAAIAATKGAKDLQDVHRLTVPALIAQIDGLIRQLYSALPKPIKKRVQVQIEKEINSKLEEKRVDLRPKITVQTIAEIVDFWSAEVLQEVIFSGLFRESKNIVPEESDLVFRHKIMHGDVEYLKYQNEESFVRLMLYADFIVNLIKQLDKGSINPRQES